jgi:hypothetical protein
MIKENFYIYTLGIAIFLGIAGVISSYLQNYKINQIILFLQLTLMTVLFIKETMNSNKLHSENLKLKGELNVKTLEIELLKNRIKN